MKLIQGLRDKLIGLIQAANRYPLTLLFLLAIATVNVNMINHDTEDYIKYFFTFLVGAFLSIVAQQLYERFFTKVSERLLLMGGTLILTAGYYLVIRSASSFGTELGTKSGVVIFALFLAFIWVPAIKSKITFNESFMSAFKAFFTTVLFTIVIAGGINLIIFAIDQLLFPLSFKANSHAMNIILSLFAPIFFLSYTPPFPGKKDRSNTPEELKLQADRVKKAASCPKTLEVLISYIIIPLTAVYTIILLAYVLLNIRGEFWTNNLLESMLVSYAITVILVYILASSLDNGFARMFRKIFPKILLPIVLFQTVSSFLRIGEIGLTHGRYYVIMFGIFAVLAGIIFSFFSIKKNGWIAAILIVFATISIVPPVDAFTASRVNQTNLLKTTLEKNNMFENGEVVPNPDISNEDKKIITRTVSYLNNMGYIERINWLPKKIFYYGNFKETFGFEEVYDYPDRGVEGRFAYMDWERSPVVNIEGFDRMVHMNITNSPHVEDAEKAIPVEIDNRNFTLQQQNEEENIFIYLADEMNNEMIRIDAADVFDLILDNEQGRKSYLDVESATVTRENDVVRVNILANSVNVYDSQYNADIYVFIKLK